MGKMSPQRVKFAHLAKVPGVKAHTLLNLYTCKPGTRLYTH